MFEKAEPFYVEQVKQAMAGVNQIEQKKLMAVLEKVRANINKSA